MSRFDVWTFPLWLVIVACVVASVALFVADRNRRP